MPQTAQVLECQVQEAYAELKCLARAQLASERPDHTLQATALVHEAYLRLGRDRSLSDAVDKSRLLSAAAEAMRRVLVDHARARSARKRGGNRERQFLRDLPLRVSLPLDELLAIHDCLDKFAAEDPVKAEFVKLRVFGGLSHLETARAMGLSRATADRYWAYARARLYSLIR